jgi:hypothetical protein
MRAPSMKATLPPAPLRQASVNQASSDYGDEHVGSVANLLPARCGKQVAG